MISKDVQFQLISYTVLLYSYVCYLTVSGKERNCACLLRLGGTLQGYRRKTAKWECPWQWQMTSSSPDRSSSSYSWCYRRLRRRSLRCRSGRTPLSPSHHPGRQSPLHQDMSGKTISKPHHLQILTRLFCFLSAAESIQWRKSLVLPSIAHFPVLFLAKMNVISIKDQSANNDVRQQDADALWLLTLPVAQLNGHVSSNVLWFLYNSGFRIKIL